MPITINEQESVLYSDSGNYKFCLEGLNSLAHNESVKAVSLLIRGDEEGEASGIEPLCCSLIDSRDERRRKFLDDKNDKCIVSFDLSNHVKELEGRWFIVFISLITEISGKEYLISLDYIDLYYGKIILDIVKSNSDDNIYSFILIDEDNNPFVYEEILDILDIKWAYSQGNRTPDNYNDLQNNQISINQTRQATLYLKIPNKYKGTVDCSQNCDVNILLQYK